MEIMNVAINLPVSALPEQVFAALTSGIALWWGEPYLYGKEARGLVLEPKIGGRFYESWHIDPDDRVGALHGTVIMIQPPSLLVLHGHFGLIDQATQGTVSFHLTKQDSGTLLQFRHHAVGQLDEETKNRYTSGWHELLNRLKALLEKHSVHGLQHDPALEGEI